MQSLEMVGKFTPGGRGTLGGLGAAWGLSSETFHSSDFWGRICFSLKQLSALGETDHPIPLHRA